MTTYMNDYINTQQNLINIRSCFGLNISTAQNIHFVESQPPTLLFPVGQTLVLHSAQQTRYIHGSGMSISCIAVTPNRQFVACAMKGKDPLIEFYELSGELKRRRQYLFPGLGSVEYISMAFSHDGRFLVTQGGGPDYNLVLWRAQTTPGEDSTLFKYDNIGHICSTTPEKNPIFQCSINPGNDTICVTGDGVFKLFRFDDGVLKPTQTGIPNRDPETYTSHCWLSATQLLVANDHGDLILVEGDSYRHLRCSPSDDLAIHTLLPTPSRVQASPEDLCGGFISGSAQGVVSIFEYSSSQEDGFERTHQLKLSNQDGLYDSQDLAIKNFSYDPQMELLALTTASGQIYYTHLASSEMISDQETMRFTHLTLPFHNGGTLTGVDVCIRKPIIATCGTDKTVRILDYQKNSMVVCQKFPTEAYSIALHPSGLYCVVGFADKLKFMKILGSKLVDEKFFAVRKCHEVKFSHGGHLFAAVNGTIINVYHSYTLQPMYSLRGHTSRVKSLQWKVEDTHIASVGLDGNLFEFQLKNEKKVNENQIKGVQLSDVCSDGKSLFCVGSDGYLRQFQDSVPQNEYSTGERTIVSMALGAVQKYVFSGMDDGSIRVYHLSSLDEFEEQIHTHEKPVVRTVITHLESMLITVSNESMFFFDIHHEGHKTSEFRYAEEILINMQELEDKNKHIKSLEQTFSELKSDNDYEQRKKEIEFNERVKEQASNFQLEMKQKIQQLYNLQTEKANLKREKESELKDNELKHKQEIQQMEHGYNQRIASAMNQIKELNSQREMERKNLEETRSMKAKQFEQEINQLQIDTNDHIRNLQEEINKLEEEKADEMDQFAETTRQSSADHQILVEKFMKKYQAKLDAQKEENLKLSGWNTIKENREKAHEKEISKLRTKINDMQNKLSDYKSKLDQKIKEKKAVRKENKDREAKIVEKEKRIFDLKKKNQELEKYKFVLDYNIASLNEQIKPSKDKKDRLVKEITGIDKDLKDYMTNNSQLKSKMQQLTEKMQQDRDVIKRMRKQVRDADIQQSRMKSEVHDIIQHIQNPKNLRDMVRDFYQTYVNKKIEKTGIDFDVQKEYDRQREHLELSVESLKNKLVKATQKAKTENMRIMHENVVLINEINQLRRESRILKSRLREKEDRITKDPSRSGALSSRSQFDNEEDVLLEQELRREMEMQQTEINSLRMRLEDLESAARARSRPVSREKLPPIK